MNQMGDGVVQNGAHDGIVRSPQGFCREGPARPRERFHDVEDPRGTLDTVEGVRAEGEVGVQRDSHDFRGSVQWGHLVTELHLWVEPGLVYPR